MYSPAESSEASVSVLKIGSSNRVLMCSGSLAIYPRTSISCSIGLRGIRLLRAFSGSSSSKTKVFGTSLAYLFRRISRGIAVVKSCDPLGVMYRGKSEIFSDSSPPLMVISTESSNLPFLITTGSNRDTEASAANPVSSLSQSAPGDSRSAAE